VSEGSGRAWHLYVKDMLCFADAVLTYTAGLDRDQFERTRLVYDATLRNLELIGEAASHIPAAVRERTPEIPWRQVVATRNRLIHGYLGIDNDTLWSIIRDDVPPLREHLLLLAKQLGAD
jgi:uncharacterized protein with HEPN domain